MSSSESSYNAFHMLSAQIKLVFHREPVAFEFPVSLQQDFAVATHHANTKCTINIIHLSININIMFVN